MKTIGYYQLIKPNLIIIRNFLMKILKKYVDRRKRAKIVVLPEEDEDLWYLYNIFKRGDKVKMKINRKIQHKTATGFVKTQKRWVLAKLEVLQVEFDYDGQGTNLYLKTVNIEENKFIDMGAMQRVQISLYYPITICKFFNFFTRLLYKNKS